MIFCSYPLILFYQRKSYISVIRLNLKITIIEKSKISWSKGNIIQNYYILFFNHRTIQFAKGLCSDQTNRIRRPLRLLRASCIEDRAYNSNFTIVINALTMGLLDVQRPSWPPPDFYHLFATFEHTRSILQATGI